MGTAKTYIPAYGTNTDKYWFPMKIAKSRALLVCEILDEEKIDYFLPTNDEANGIWLVIHHDYYHTHNCYHKILLMSPIGILVTCHIKPLSSLGRMTSRKKGGRDGGGDVILLYNKHLPAVVVLWTNRAHHKPALK